MARSWGARRIAAIVLLSSCSGTLPSSERSSPAGCAIPPVAQGAAALPGSWRWLQPNCARQRKEPARLVAGRLREGCSGRTYALPFSLRGGDDSDAGFQQMEQSSSSDGPNLDSGEGGSKGRPAGAAGDGAGAVDEPAQPVHHLARGMASTRPLSVSPAVCSRPGSHVHLTPTHTGKRCARGEYRGWRGHIRIRGVY